MRPPPALARRLLVALLPDEERDFVLGDLDEEFLRRAEVSARGARRWYWAEVLRSAWPLMTYPGRGGVTMVGFTQDLRGALRVFRRAPGFASVVVLTLGIGVGGAAAVFSVVRGVVLTPLPFEDPDRVVMLWGRSAEYPRAPLTVGDHNALANDVAAFTEVAAAWSNNALILGEAGAEQVSVGWVTPEYFELLGIAPSIGRTFGPLEENAVVISHALWVRRYGSRPDVVGQTIDLSGTMFEVIGVLPPDRDPNLTTFAGARAGHQVWRLQPPDWTRGDDRSVGWLRSTARLADGVTLAQAQAEVDALIQRINETITERDGGMDMSVQLVPVKADLVGGVSRTLWILLAAVVGVLLIAASNVAHLVLARGELRSSEVAVRAALGGSRGRLVRQLVVESSVLALAGGLLGIGLASIGVPLLLSLAPPSLPRLDLVRLDWGVFGFALLATAVASIVFAVIPAVRSTRTDLAKSLGERGGTGDPARQRLSRALIVAEVAVSLALVTSTGLLLRSFAGLNEVDLGFQKDGVVTFALEAPDWGGSGEAAAATMRAYLDRIGEVPGVQAAGFTNRIPLAGGLFTGEYRTEEMVAADSDPARGALRYITPDYIDALGGRLVAGRTFRAEDGLDVVLVDEAAARRLWPGEDAVGRSIEVSGVGAEPAMAEVIGVVASMKHHGVAQPATETVFLPMLAAANQQNFRYMAVRVAGEPGPYVDRLREATRLVSGDAVIARVQTMRELFDEDVAATRFASLLLAIFGAIAVLLAAVGLHGVMAFSVRRRAREIGIRVVLGAEHGSILRDAVGSGAVLVIAGIGVGTLLSLGAGRVLQSLLYEVGARDVGTLLVSAVVMLMVGLVGAYLPARLVLAVDPAVTLKDE